MAIKVHQKLVFINTLYKVTPSSDCLVHALAHFLGFLASLSLAVCDVRAQVMKWRMSLIRKHLDLTLCHFVYQQVTLIDVPYIKGKCTFYNEIIRFYILVFFWILPRRMAAMSSVAMEEGPVAGGQGGGGGAPGWLAVSPLLLRCSTKQHNTK